MKARNDSHLYKKELYISIIVKQKRLFCTQT